MAIGIGNLTFKSSLSTDDQIIVQSGGVTYRSTLAQLLEIVSHTTLVDANLTGNIVVAGTIAAGDNISAGKNLSAAGTITANGTSTVNEVSTSGTITVPNGGIYAASGIKSGDKVYNGVWNDLVDCIEVEDDTELEFGYCYCFDGEKYHKSEKYLDNGIIGIHSDTAGFVMGSKETHKEMQVSVAGFVLAYVDREYKPGTPLTCTCCGMLTEIHKQDKMEYPEKIVATYWKPEPDAEWGSNFRKIPVNGRHWVKIK